ncbi:MAG: sugar transferase [Peptococcaceae bacterium]|nr:sugar transferase [Peptococcaceae bacterium]
MFVKRILDLFIAAVLMLIVALLWLLIVIWIRLDSPGPAIFRQIRIGRGGKPFTIYKFRTMVQNADEVMRQRLEKLKAEGEFDPDNFIFQEKDDPRVTPSGRFLRRTSLDELPQLLNILNGTMSVVGPRPEVPEIVSEYTPEQRGRLEMLPGVTGLAQVSGRSDLTLSQTLEYDLEYVRGWRLGLDFRILVRTVRVVFSGR